MNTPVPVTPQTPNSSPMSSMSGALSSNGQLHAGSFGHYLGQFLSSPEGQKKIKSAISFAPHLKPFLNLGKK